MSETYGQEVETIAYWLAHWRLTQPAFLYSSESTAHSGLDPLTSTTNRWHDPLAYRPFWWRSFLNWDSLFPEDPCLCQTAKTKPTSTTSSPTLSLYKPSYSLNALQIIQLECVIYFPLGLWLMNMNSDPHDTSDKRGAGIYLPMQGN